MSMKCPITNGVLEHVGESHNGMVHYYKSTGNRSLTFRRFRTEWHIMEMGKGGAVRHFHVDGDVLIDVKKYGDKWLPLNATQDQIDSAVSDYRSRQLESFDYVNFPQVRHVEASSISADLVPVIPESSPQSTRYIVPVYNSRSDDKVKTDIDYDSRPDVSPDDCELVEYITGKMRDITEDTIAADVEFFGPDVAVGDAVYYWDMGGWHSLSGRAGEAVFRGNLYITSKLLRMS